MRHRFLVRAILSTALLVGTAGVAYADPTPQDIAQARDLGQQAQAAFEAGNFAESEKLWTGAANLYPQAPTLTLGLARTQVKLGKLVLAQESYNKIIREKEHSPSNVPAFKDAYAAAAAEVGPVSAKIASVVIRVEGPTNPTVTLDGQPVSAAGLGLKRPVDPGSHVVKAEAPGFKPAETSFQVAESGAAEAKLKLEKSADAPVAAAPSQPAPHDASGPVDVGTGKSSRKTLALAALGVGGAGLIFGTITGVIAMGKHSDLEGQCPDGKCPNGVSGDVDSYKTMGTLSTIGFIVGGVGVAAGAVLWFTAPKSGTATGSASTTHVAKGFSWQPFVTAGGGGVAGRF
jgi:hypothetical protein